MLTKKKTGSDWVDPDDAPKLTREWFDAAEIYRGDIYVRGGNGPAATEPVSVRLDQEVLRTLRAQGAGWQSSVNALLRAALGLSPPE
jgi:uncharacterized protein (DUF4415 family)